MLHLALLLACGRSVGTPAPEPVAALDLACETHLDCKIDCLTYGDCCGQLCGPCQQVYNRAGLATAKAWEAAECRAEIPCPVADCAATDVKYEARCVDHACQAVAVPLAQGTR